MYEFVHGRVSLVRLVPDLQEVLLLLTNTTDADGRRSSVCLSSVVEAGLPVTDQASAPSAASTVTAAPPASCWDPEPAAREGLQPRPRPYP